MEEAYEEMSKMFNYYYGPSHNLNEIVSGLRESYLDMQVKHEGDLIILSTKLGNGYVGVQSSDNKFIFIEDTSNLFKKCVSGIVFE